MSYQHLKYGKDGHVGVVTFDRAPKLNALSQELMNELSEVLDEVNADKDVRCLVITGEGERAFSVGFDLDGYTMPERTDEIREEIQANSEVFLKIWNLRIPTISAVNGYAIAAGSNIAMICDITLASDRAKFGEPELRHFALSPLLLLPWFNGNPKMVHYLYYSGDTIGAEEAYEYGLVAKVVPHQDLMEETMRMAKRIAMVAPFAVEMTKDSIRKAYELMGFMDAMHYHRANDALVIGASGIPEKRRFFELMGSGDMQTFLENRDGPFKQTKESG